MIVLEIFTDGGSSGNPGISAIAFVMKKNTDVVKEFSKPIGTATNNVAEYTAVIYALQEALVLREREILLHSDSELLCRQLNGQYRVKEAHLQPLFEQVKHLAKGFDRLEIRHIPRTQNQEADRLVKTAIKKEQTKVVASSS